MKKTTTLLDTLHRAMVQGATWATVGLAGCFAPVSDEPALEPVVSRPSADGGGDVDAGARDAGPVDGGSAPFDAGPPYDVSRVACESTCCTRVHCYTPDAGTCQSATEARVNGASLSPPITSLGCGCSGSYGPFSRTPADPAAPPGACCYLLEYTSICVGRPMLVEGDAVVAATVHRGDWLA